MCVGVGGGGGYVDLNYSPGAKYILYCYQLLLSAIVSASSSPVTINERGILNLITCEIENKGNRAHRGT